MSIESLLEAIRKERETAKLFVPPPANSATIDSLALEFQESYGHELPDAYRRMLSLSDGVMFNGLTLWPTHAYWKFRESLIEANRDLRDTVEEHLLYYGQQNDVLYVFDIRDTCYRALEMSGLSVWKEFANCDEMIEFMLERALM